MSFITILPTIEASPKASQPAPNLFDVIGNSTAALEDFVGLLENFMKIFVSILTLLFTVANAQAKALGPAKNIVIVHGAFADGSGWKSVAQTLTDHGYNVTIVNNSTVSLANDVAATKEALARQNGPVVLVGHSYGGEVITQAGDDEKVKALVYVAAYVPDEGESLGGLLGLTVKLYPNIKAPPIIPAKDGFLMVDPAQFSEFFAADLAKRDPVRVQSMADHQLPLGAQTLKEKITTIAWRVNKPKYYIIPTEDRMIPPAFEKWMAKRAAATLFPIEASHAVYASQPDKVAGVIDTAASKIK